VTGELAGLSKIILIIMPPQQPHNPPAFCGRPGLKKPIPILSLLLAIWIRKAIL